MKRLLLAITAILSVLGITALTGCSSAGQVRQHDKPVIFASFYPIYSLVSDIAGDNAEVHSFMPTGQDPHLWEPTPQNIKDLAGADLLVINGANMEPWVGQVHDALPNLQILRLSDYVELINYKGAAALGEFQYMAHAHFEKGKLYTIEFGHTHERSMRGAFFKYDSNLSTRELIERGRQALNDEGTPTKQHSQNNVQLGQVYDMAMGHESGDISYVFPESGEWAFVSDRESEDLLSYKLVDSAGHDVAMEKVIEGGSSKTDHSTFDPHSWLSVTNAKRYSNAIFETLRTMDPANEEAYHKNKSSVVRDLTNMQAQFAEKIINAPHKQFLTVHNAFAYMARDYKLKQIPLQGLTTNEAPTLRVLTDSIRFARKQSIDVVFYEYGSDSKTANVVAQEIGGKALPLNSMEYGTGVAGENLGYLGYMKLNLENLYESLS